MTPQTQASAMSTVVSPWPIKPLGDLLTFLTSGSRGWAQYYSESGSLFLRIQNVGRNKMLLDDVAFVSPPATAEGRRTLVQPGDVLLSITADLGRTGVVPEGLGDTYISQHLAILRVAHVHPPFLSAYLASQEGQTQIFGRNRQGVKAGLNFDDIRSFKIPLPALSEQRRIAEVLDRAEALRAKRRAALLQLDELTHAIFTSLFGDPARNTKHLPTLSLGELGEWQSGGTPPRDREDYFEGSIPWFSSGELNNMIALESHEHISDAALHETTTKRVPEGSLMLGMYDTAALKASIAGVDCACNQAIAFGKMDLRTAVPVFVYFAIVIGREHFRRMQRGVRQKNLNLSMVREIRIPIPRLSLQQDFARRIAAVDKLKATHRASLAELDALFASLQHRAFRGEL
jgi:type I restriction enzyme S subunit